MPSGLPSPPSTDGDIKPKPHPKRDRDSKESKAGKVHHRNLKRASSVRSQDQPGMSIDGRHKRVWKACERCRMKKTKCDGESPCKRCKDDGLVCTAGSRKKAEFKQLPRGYAEVLENTQYALIATVQKLYTMVRNGEAWELGEPQINGRGQPVIHNIAEKLGCLRPSPDLPYAFPEDAQEFADLQNRMKLESHDEESGAGTPQKSNFPERKDRASSTESDHSDHEREHEHEHDHDHDHEPEKQYWPQRLQSQMPPLSSSDCCAQSQVSTDFGDDLDVETELWDSPLDEASISPIFPNFNNFSLDIPSESNFTSWSSSDDFIAPGMLDLTAMQMGQPQLAGSAISNPISISSSAPRKTMPPGAFGGANASMAPGAQGAYLWNNDGTIRPGMLDCATGSFDVNEQLGFVYADYATQPMAMR